MCVYTYTEINLLAFYISLKGFKFFTFLNACIIWVAKQRNFAQETENSEEN